MSGEATAPGTFVLMWAGMMLVMMAPTALLLARAYRAALRAIRGEWFWTAALLAGYLGVWVAFGIAAGLAQAALDGFGLLAPDDDRLGSRAACGALVAAAGLYQFTPVKSIFVEHCRRPLGFVAGHWRDGPGGAAGMGVLFGVHCLGCCWLLFAALFALGTMSVAWMAVLLAIVVAERYGRFADWARRGAGAAGVAYGALLLLS
jgi:predicted metal-binding membrane protein